MKYLDKVLALAKKYSYFSPIYLKANGNLSDLNLGHSGLLLRDNIKFQWIHSNVSQRNEKFHLFDYTGKQYTEHDFYHSYISTRDSQKQQLPFGIAEMYNLNKIERDTLNSEENIFCCSSYTVLSSSIFLPPHNASKYLFNWQRQRKLWWKKISGSPERFFLGDSYSSPKGITVDLLGEYPWGNEILETITMSELDTTNDVKAYHRRKSVIPVHVTSRLSLETAFVALFCDAFDFKSHSDTTVLRLNRILTPYKCIFGFDNDSNKPAELLDLAVYLFEDLKSNGITSVLLFCTLNIEQQLQRNDEWGIPYTVLINDNSLKNGIVSLRCRNTTLKEDLHITDLVPYISQVFKYV
ncbi:DNA polymerase subunit gamma-2, mitochondrial [Arctopsyche grandis]|uniref:DNA polymerase subunit gamma-2, mitochondrial n=1 Tax=Arctopsyche grandis TaxID=121162 RepID=UPI00406D8AC0